MRSQGLALLSHTETPHHHHRERERETHTHPHTHTQRYGYDGGTGIFIVVNECIYESSGFGKQFM